MLQAASRSPRRSPADLSDLASFSADQTHGWSDAHEFGAVPATATTDGRLLSRLSRVAPGIAVSQLILDGTATTDRSRYDEKVERA